MVSLKSVGERFYILFDVIEGGSGQVRGVLTETDQAAQPSYVFVQPRHVFRTPYPTAITAGMVIRSPSGDVFIVGDNGPSEQREGTLWMSFRLFEASGRYIWSRRQRTKDQITNLPRDFGEPEVLGTIWAVLEALDRQVIDLTLRQNFEQTRFITGVNIQDGDLIDNRTVTKVDTQLGLRIGVLT